MQDRAFKVWVGVTEVDTDTGEELSYTPATIPVLTVASSMLAHEFAAELCKCGTSRAKRLQRFQVKDTYSNKCGKKQKRKSKAKEE